MAAAASSSRSMSAAWGATWAIPIGAQCAAAVWLGSSAGFDRPLTQFLGVTVAAMACVLASAALVLRAFRTNEAEIGCLGTFLSAASTLLLVHGITTPDVIFGANNAHSLSLLLVVPVGLATVMPFLAGAVAGRATRGATRAEALLEAATRRLREHWGLAVGASFTAVTLLMMGLLAGAQAVPAAAPQQPITMAVAVASIVASVVISQRHLRLARIAHRAGPLVGSASFGLVAVSAAIWLAPGSFEAGAPVASALIAGGVLVGTLGVNVVYRRSETFDKLIGPVLSVEPLSALEVSLDPVVRQFVAGLEGEDAETLDHVVRTRDLALRVGNELRLTAPQLRDLGLAAILHDVGKVGIPAAILTKTERLTPEEFEIMQHHVVIGERMVAASPAIATVAPSVRSHHERMDGGGYPDGLSGLKITKNARIVAVCDAYDAMANSRRYRAGMGHDKAVAILREHAGSQWDPVVVEALVMTLARNPLIEELHVQIDAIGRDLDSAFPSQRGLHIGCDCLPDSVLESMESLDGDGSVERDAPAPA